MIKESFEIKELGVFSIYKIFLSDPVIETPQLFLCKSLKTGKKYYVMEEEEYDLVLKYLMCEISDSEIDELLNNKIKIVDFMKKSKELIMIENDFDKQEIFDYKIINFKELTDDDLPANCYLKIRGE